MINLQGANGKDLLLCLIAILFVLVVIKVTHFKINYRQADIWCCLGFHKWKFSWANSVVELRKCGVCAYTQAKLISSTEWRND